MATYYLDIVNGNNLNPGTFQLPWQQLDYAFLMVSPGDTLVLGIGGSFHTVSSVPSIPDLTIIGAGEGIDSRIRVSTGSLTVLGHLTLKNVHIYTQVPIGFSTIVVAPGGSLTAIRTVFESHQYPSIELQSGAVFVELLQCVVAYRPSLLWQAGIIWDGGDLIIKNSILDAFPLGIAEGLNAGVFTSVCNCWNCISTIEGGAGYPGDVDIFADPQFVDPINRDYSLKGSSPCIDKGMDLGLADFAGPFPDIGWLEYAPVQEMVYASFYNIHFFLWLMAVSLDEVQAYFEATRDNRSIETCDGVTLSRKFGPELGVFRPSSFTELQFRDLLKGLISYWKMAPARAVFDFIFESVLPAGDYYEFAYYSNRLWSLGGTGKLTVVHPPTPSLDVAWDAFFFNAFNQWFRVKAGTATVTDNAYTWVYADGTEDADKYAVVQFTSDLFFIPQGSYILGYVRAQTGDVTELMECGDLGVDSYIPTIVTIFNTVCLILKDSGQSIFDLTDEEVVFLRSIFPKVFSAHKLIYAKFVDDVYYWQVQA